MELTHKKIDEAVFAAYGWPSDLSEEKILERLLALNLERAGHKKEIKKESDFIRLEMKR